MRTALAAAGTAVLLGVATIPGVASSSTGAAAPPQPQAAQAVALWEMNEGPGATSMHDSSGNGLNGNIVPSDQIQTGFTFNGATGYHWVRRAPNQPPAVPERIIQVPDNDQLDPTDPSVTYTLEVRYRTREDFGNIVQKGQANTRGGQIKIQNPMGRPSCLFTGAIRRVSTRSTVALNDNAWHVLTCVKTATSVTIFVDGVQNHRQNGNTGVINNSIPYTVGGKINCDQIEITCDYFSGDIDYVRIYKG
jgi:hypothetical protein